MAIRLWKASGAAVTAAATMSAALLAAQAPQEMIGLAYHAGKPAKNVVVWLDVPGATVQARTPRVVLDQRNMQFAPHVLAVPVGTAVEMPNSDRVFHNVFSFHNGKVFDLGVYPAGTSKTVVFDTPGFSRIFCNIHPNMAAYIVAVASSFVAVSDRTGRFTIAGVDDGSYAFHAWRPGADPTTGTIQVTAGRPSVVHVP